MVNCSGKHVQQWAIDILRDLDKQAQRRKVLRSEKQIRPYRHEDQPWQTIAHIRRSCEIRRQSFQSG